MGLQGPKREVKKEAVQPRELYYEKSPKYIPEVSQMIRLHPFSFFVSNIIPPLVTLEQITNLSSLPQMRKISNIKKYT
jgi:hypothetical protein